MVGIRCVAIYPSPEFEPCAFVMRIGEITAAPHRKWGTGGYPSLGEGENVWIMGPRWANLSTAEGDPQVPNSPLTPRQSGRSRRYRGCDIPRAPFQMWPIGIFTNSRNKSARAKPRIGENCDTSNIKPGGNRLGELTSSQRSPIVGLGRALSLCESAKLPPLHIGNGNWRLAEPGRGRKCAGYRKTNSGRGDFLPRCSNWPCGDP